MISIEFQPALLSTVKMCSRPSAKPRLRGVEPGIERRASGCIGDAIAARQIYADAELDDTGWVT